MNGLLDVLLSLPEPVFFALLPLAVVGLWCAISLLLALVGWRDLARTYATKAAPHGTPFGSLAGSVGIASYRGIKAWAAPEGLFLSMPWLLRLGHPPVLIPWRDIRNVRVSRVLWGDIACFEAGDPGTPMKLPARVFEGRLHGSSAPDGVRDSSG